MADRFRDELIATARAIGTPGKGILAADESTGTIGQRFVKINVENTEPNRQAYRQLLFTTPGIEQYISGVIMFEETLGQSSDDGTPFPALLKQKGIITGIKVDKGVSPLRGTDGETFTQGLDGLAQRCAEYYNKGARFAKWRAVLKIGNGCPSEISIKENCSGLARYAAICQDNGLVPIVEPEVLMDGDHDLETCVRATQRVLAYQYYALAQANVLLEGTILKCNMVCPGASCPVTYTPEQVGQATAVVLSRTVPPAVPTVNFLSGGLSEEEASIYLNALNRSGGVTRPWNLSFSFGRALQQSCLAAWRGNPENIEAAQQQLLIRAKANSEASTGSYSGGAGGVAAGSSSYVSNYSY